MEPGTLSLCTNWPAMSQKIVLHKKLWWKENPTIIAKYWRNHGNKAKWITFTMGLTKVVGLLDGDVMSGDDRLWIWWYFQWALILKWEIKEQSLLVQVSSRDTALVHRITEFKEFKAWQSMLTGIIWPPAHWQVDGRGGRTAKGWRYNPWARIPGQS
jgi:hypothetical protein